MKPVVYIPTQHNILAGWNKTLIKMLFDGGVFDVQTKDLPEVYSLKPGGRAKNWNLFEINNKVIGLDTWDSYQPTSRLFDLKYFSKDGKLRPLDLIIKVQYYPCKYWTYFTKNTGIPVKPWTVMPNAQFPLAQFQWENKKHKYTTAITGRNNRFGRQVWVNFCENKKDLFTFKDYKSRDPMTDYINLIQECRWGVSLKGRQRRHDGKNRRECEYSSCGMPMALNYQPHYDFDFKAGEHFFLLTKPEDLEKLRDTDPLPFHKASVEIYQQYFSPQGMSNLLLKMAKELV